MATSAEYITFVCDQIAGIGAVRSRKMFGEYMVYVNDKPLLLVCDDTVYAKIIPALETVMSGAARGVPYAGAKEHYILDIEDRETARAVIEILEPVTPLPKSRRRHREGSV